MRWHQAERNHWNLLQMRNRKKESKLYWWIDRRSWATISYYCKWNWRHFQKELKRKFRQLSKIRYTSWKYWKYQQWWQNHDSQHCVVTSYIKKWIKWQLCSRKQWCFFTKSPSWNQKKPTVERYFVPGVYSISLEKDICPVGEVVHFLIWHFYTYSLIQVIAQANLWVLFLNRESQTPKLSYKAWDFYRPKMTKEF